MYPKMPWSFASIHILKMLIIFAGSFHGHLPSYKLVLLFEAQYLTGRVKMTGDFLSYGLLTVFCQLQIRHRDEIVH